MLWRSRSNLAREPPPRAGGWSSRGRHDRRRARPDYPLTDGRTRANVSALCGLISNRTISGWTFLTCSSIAATIASTSAADSVSTKSTLIAATICSGPRCTVNKRSEEHTSELQSPYDLVCRLLLEKKKTNNVATDDLRQKTTRT